MITKLDPKQTYTATLVISSIGAEDVVTLDGIYLDPDISEESIDAGEIPWSYRLMSFLLGQLKQQALDIDPSNLNYPAGSRRIM